MFPSARPVQAAQDNRSGSATVADLHDREGHNGSAGSRPRFGQLGQERDMRKTLMGLGVIAAMAMAGSASAWTWSISGATAGGSSPGGGTFDIRAQVNNYFASNFGPGGNPQGAANLNQLDASNILTNLGVTLASDTLTYFSFVDAAGRGYMAAAYLNSKGSNFEAFVSGNNWLGGSQGLFSTHSLAIVGGGSAGVVTIQSGRTFLMVMGGYESGAAQITMNFNSEPNNGGFGVNYLSYNYGTSSYGVLASGSATESQGSGMNVAVYTVPVPAPMMLAGLGIVGGIALRRRLAK
jgi:hypothetical protein